MQLVSVACCLMTLCSPLSAGWLDRKAEGWAWYENPTVPIAQESPIVEETPPSASETLDLARKELEEKLARAILDPTEQNAQLYMEAQKTWMQRSAAFSKAWSHVLLASPELDPSATTFATSQYGRQLQKTIEQEQNESLIKEIASSYGLFFFYQGGSKKSQAFAKVVRDFSDRYHWSILGISVDGVMIDEIVHSKLDTGVAEKMGVTVLPALIAVDPKTQQAIPLAFGLQALDRIESNTIAQFKYRGDR